MTHALRQGHQNCTDQEKGTRLDSATAMLRALVPARGDQCKFAHGERDPMAWCVICEKRGHIAGDKCKSKHSKN